VLAGAAITADQIGHQFRYSIFPPSSPAELDRHVAALDVSGFPQAFAECFQAFGGRVRRSGAEKPDHRHRWLLRARRARPRGRRAAERG
jgi:hypothetical protein